MALKLKIEAIKLVRSRTGLALKESKNIVDIIDKDNIDVYRSGNLMAAARIKARPIKVYEDFHFLERAFEALIISGRGSSCDHRMLAQEAISLSRQMAKAANEAMEISMNIIGSQDISRELNLWEYDRE